MKKLNNIEHADAIMRYDETRKSEEHPVGKPYEPEWPEVDYIVGNPPFLGGNQMRSGRPATKKTPALQGLGDLYVDQLRALYLTRVPGGADLVAYWFEKTRSLIAMGHVARAGLIATQSIRAGSNRKVLTRIKVSGDIFMAWGDRRWVLDGAAVRVSLIAFDDGSESTKMLNGIPVGTIHPNLQTGSDVTSAFRLKENLSKAFQGPVKVGSFEISNELAKMMLMKPNPHGLPNSEVIKPWVNGDDIVGRPHNRWIIDFGSRTDHEAALYEAPFEHIESFVKPKREKNKDKQRREKWWRLGRSGGDLRKATAGVSRIILTSRVEKHRFFVWVPKATVPDARVIAIASDSDCLMGVLHSRPHLVWVHYTSSRHGVGNDPTYNSESCFETFPFPYPPGTEPTEADSPIVRAIADAARELVRLRDAWLNPPNASEDDLKSRTLTKLYNARPEWLAYAHRTLDTAVFAAYGWPANLTDQEILARLLALNHERAALGS